MSTTKDPLLLLDAYGLIYRFYFAFISRPLRNNRGENISALHGLSRFVYQILTEGFPLHSGDPSRSAGVFSEGASPSKTTEPSTKVTAPSPKATGTTPAIIPQHMAVVFDSPVATFRHERYPEYKATRQKAPQDLHAQVPLVKEFLATLGIPILQVERYEADDIIATLAERCKKEGRSCYFISSDKDLLQMVGEGVFQLRPAKTAGTSGSIAVQVVGPQEVAAEWAAHPGQILDLLALTGDSSDNVPGVKGIGDKTAIKLIQEYHSLDNLYAHIDEIEGALQKKLIEGREMAYFSRELIQLVTQVPLPVQDIEGELRLPPLHFREAGEYLKRQGLRQVAAAFLERSSTEKEPSPVSQAQPELCPSPAPSLPAGKKQGTGPARETAGQAFLFEEVPADTSQAEESTEGKLEGTHPTKGEEIQISDRGTLTDKQEKAQSATTPSYQCILEAPELEALFRKAREQRLLALDFETTSLEALTTCPVGFSFALMPGEAYYVPLMSHGVGSPFLDPPKGRALLEEVLQDPRMVIVAHNAKFDYQVSRTWGCAPWKARIWDTMVAAWLLDPDRGNYSMDGIVAQHLGLPSLAYDTVVPKGAAFNEVPLDMACRYSAEDADYALRLYRLFYEKLNEAGQLGLFTDLEMPLLPILAEMERVGIRIDPRILREYGKELDQQLASLEQEVYRLVGHPFNISSTKQLQEVLFVERKLQATKKTKTGFSTDVEVLQELAREDPVPAYILRYRTLSKLKSTYVDTLADQVGRDGRLHTHFIQTGTATGRLSSRDPNLQNIPIRDEEGRRIRQAFVAEPGQVLISADYSQIELVILAHLSEDPALCEAFRRGEDVHRRTAALLFGVPEDAVQSDQRRIAKTINFGIMYGMSAFRLSSELGIGRGEAQDFINLYFATYRGIQDFIHRTIEEAEKTGYVTTLLGRKRFIPTITSRNKTEKAAAERIAINTPIQGSAADIVKLAMIRLQKALNEQALEARLLLQVHDELILECPRSRAEEVAQLVKSEMEGAYVLKVPLRVEVEIGERWGDFH
ncbi:MAG TPA: DNA polymerase I [Termitinemataceae bacterium]|nr:DNA polymerase I [Termitinemataceae bacterium]HOM23995.1 DNA polymerase I [Termitinemataceae bacterium]HPQ01068.1 DNA polymerase I [Termitinemataceae bacterium]